jgi:group I intron endonuclease
MSDNKWTLYIHITPSSPIHKVYVGITSKSTNVRWRKNGKGYRGYFWNAICKYGWNNIHHIILECGICEPKAKDLEKKLIAIFKSNDPIYGYNLTEGGDGTCGHKLDEESKEKLRKYAKKRFENLEEREKASKSAKKHFENPEVHVKLSESLKKYHETPEARIKNREAQKKYYENPEAHIKCSKGQKRRYENPEEHLKSSESQKKYYAENPEARARLCKKVNQYDAETGGLIKTWNSATEIRNTLKINSGMISFCCHHKQKTAGGYRWEFASNEK